MYLVVAPAAVVATTVTTAVSTTATTVTAAAISTAATTITTTTTSAAIRATETAIVAAAFAVTTTVATTVRATTTTTAAAIGTATAATAVSTTAFAWCARLSGARFVHNHSATAELLAMHTCNGSLCLSVIGHFDESETFGAASIALHHHACTGHATKRAESGLQIIVTNGIWQVANVQSITHLVYLSTSAPKRMTPLTDQKKRRSPEHCEIFRAVPVSDHPTCASPPIDCDQQKGKPAPLHYQAESADVNVFRLKRCKRIKKHLIGALL
jgi:hypothetical protein